MKDRVYGLLRRLGVFWFSGLFFRKQLLILCYHGISISDEHNWWPGVFMKEQKFRKRLEILKEGGYRVIGLGEALQKLDDNKLPAKSIVITADDGYLNSPQTFAKACLDFGYPSTIYVTSYYAEKQTPIFNVTVQYLFWKINELELWGDFSKIGLTGTSYLDISTAEKRKEIAQQVVTFGRTHCNEEQRQDILRNICGLVGQDYASLARSGMFRLMGAPEIRSIANSGIDVQLHTHRHSFPVDQAAASREIEENREFLKPLVKRPLEHFCYPSGFWEPRQLPWLRELGIQSATTCRLGFVSRNSDKLCLNRYLDKQTISDHEFRAEISGFLNIARRIRGKVKILWK